MEFFLVFAVVLAMAWGAERLWRSAARGPYAGRQWWSVTMASAVAGYLIGYFVMAFGFLVAAGNFDVASELGMSDLTVVAWICAGSGFFAGVAAGYAGVGGALATVVGGVLAGVVGGAVLWLVGSTEPVLTEILLSAVGSILTAVLAMFWLHHRAVTAKKASGRPARHVHAH